MMDLREQVLYAVRNYSQHNADEIADAVIEVLRQQKPVAWREFDGEGGYDYRSFDDNENFRDEYIKRNGDKYATWVEPLYAAPGAQADVPAGWLRAIDEEMVGAHIGVADSSDDYVTAKEKLNRLICWHIAVATDPAVNGGWQLVPIEPTNDMLRAACVAWTAGVNYMDAAAYRYRAMLNAAPKPEGK